MSMEQQNRLLFRIAADGQVEYGEEYGPREAAESLWTAFGASQFITVNVNGRDIVRVRLDGQAIVYLNGYQPSAEASELWHRVASIAPLAAAKG